MQIYSFCFSCDHLDDKPVEDLNERDDAESKAQPKQATNSGNEVNPSHSSGLFIF